MSESDQKVLPSGFVAANTVGQATSALCGALSLVDAGQDMLCCIALELAKHLSVPVAVNSCATPSQFGKTKYSLSLLLIEAIVAHSMGSSLT